MFNKISAGLSLSDKVALELLQKIESGEFPPGAKLPTLVKASGIRRQRQFQYRPDQRDPVPVGGGCDESARPQCGCTA